MRETGWRGVVLVAGLAGGVGIVAGAALGRATYPPLEVLLSSSETVLGQPIAYPEGLPLVTAAIVTMAPGQETGWHTHPVPLFAWMLEGELTIDYDPDGTRVYRSGDAFLEAFRTRHDGRNTGDGEARILAVFMGAAGVANTVLEGE